MKLLGALALVSAAIVVTYINWKGTHPPKESSYFYDLSKRALFEAPIDSVPPIRGIDDNEPDGVRAIVVSTSGNCRDAESRRILYLEKYSDLLKHEMEARLSTPPGTEAPSTTISRAQARMHTFVKAIEDADWSTIDSERGEALINRLSTPDPSGKLPLPCVP